LQKIDPEGGWEADNLLFIALAFNTTGEHCRWTREKAQYFMRKRGWVAE
jgi:hypothetical protein